MSRWFPMGTVETPGFRSAGELDRQQDQHPALRGKPGGAGSAFPPRGLSRDSGLSSPDHVEKRAAGSLGIRSTSSTSQLR